METKKNILFSVFLLWFLAGSCRIGDEGEPELGRACPVEAVEGLEDDIVGKWKMVWMRRGFTIENLDYSCSNIIYHFRPEDILEVNNDVEEAGYAVGEYDYELISGPYNMGASTGVKIGDFQCWACFLESTTMTLDSRPLDGPKKHFIRIE